MLDTLTMEELLRHRVQHGPMTEMERVLFERLEEMVDLVEAKEWEDLTEMIKC